MSDFMNCHVYIDFKPTGVPFYVGKGDSTRVKYIERNIWHSNICKKYPDWYRKVVETASDEMCKEFEMLLISEIGRRDLGKGPLVNLTDGGEGTSGVVVGAKSRRLRSENAKKLWESEQHREQVSKKLKEAYMPGSELIEKISMSVKKALSDPLVKERHRLGISKSKTDEVRQRTSETLKEQRSSLEYRNLMSERMKKVCWTPESKERLSKATKGRIWVTDGVIGRRISPGEPIPAGFRRGKPDKRSRQLGHTIDPKT